MANCFGEVIDNYKLDTMARYVGEQKTQQDRAREAMKYITEGGKNDKAAKYAQTVKDYYGQGVSTLCLIYNATGETLYYETHKDWWGNISRTPYPTEIKNGQWAAFQHVHFTGDVTSGSTGAVVYRGRYKSKGYDYERALVVGWDTPWAPWSPNSCYCDVAYVYSYHESSCWNAFHNKLENAGKSETANSHGFVIQVDTAAGGAPLFRAIMKIPYTP